MYIARVTAPPLAAETVFIYVGAVTAAWAVLLAVIGLSRADFPGKGRGGERVVIAISALLVAGAIATAIGTAKQGPHAGTQTAKTRPNASPAAGAPSSTGAAAAKLTLSTDPGGQLRFNTTTLQAKAGSVQIVMSNPAPISHNISLQGAGVDAHGATVGHGGTSTVTATLKPGTYTFYCSVPGHRQAGMQGTLTVK
jgi:uncharacterized cupredoxin-like copper-binding protein